MRHRSILYSKVCSKGFVWLALLGCALLDTNIVSAQQVTVVSSASDGTAATGGDSREPSISGDGRFVAFASAATNLVPGDTNGTFDVFVKDRLSGATSGSAFEPRANKSVCPAPRRGSRRTDGSSPSSRLLHWLRRTPTSCGSVPPECADVYVHDRQTHVTTRVSVSSTGAQGAGHSRVLSITSDGRFVLFGRRRRTSWTTTRTSPRTCFFTTGRPRRPLA